MTTTVVITTPTYPIDVRIEFETLTVDGWKRDEKSDVILGSGATWSTVIYDSKRISGIYEVATSKLASAPEAGE